jgi:rubredoxin
MAEAAYKTTVLNGGKKQTKLTPGYEVLGLEKATAQRIFDEEKKEGFLTAREAMYGGQRRKYDKKGNQIDEATGELTNPDDALVDDEGAAGPAEPVSNVYECGECGYTLFIAKGREGKFYGDDFKCPECGAGKDKFEARDDLDDE